MVLSGYLHSAEMAADNLLSAQMGSKNGNFEHLYGDVLRWFVIASLSLIFLRATRNQQTFGRMTGGRGVSSNGTQQGTRLCGNCEP